MNKYSPRRQSARWLDGDCPSGVLAIYDHPKYGDRYTVFYASLTSGSTYADMWIGYRSMSENPCHPQGIGLFGEMNAQQTANFRYINRHRACNWSDLPQAVKDVVIADLKRKMQ